MPLCGASEDYIFDDLQRKSVKNAGSFAKDLPHEFKCPCKGLDDTIGVNIRKREKTKNGEEMPTPGESNLRHIAKITGCDLVKTNRECAWVSYVDSVWPEVQKLIRHKDSGITIKHGTIPNFVYEAYLYYLGVQNQVESYILNKQREESEKKRKEAEMKNNAAKNHR